MGVKKDYLAMWNSEALKHGMSYGQYRAAVSSGLLPKPEWYEEHKPEQPRRPDTKCPVCGVMFVKRRVNQLCCSCDCKKVRDMYFRSMKLKSRSRREQEKQEENDEIPGDLQG